MPALSSAPDTLSTAQLDAVVYLAAGISVSATAQQLDVHRATIHNWLKLPEFQAEVRQAREDHAEYLQAKLKEIADLALDTIRQTLTDPAVSPAVKLKAALAVLDRPLFPKPSAAVPAEPAQQPATATPVGVPRNAACPCGSGNKYKRCCGSNAPPQLSRAA
jgi:uncharacterized protein YecA (UPF0149 family)